MPLVEFIGGSYLAAAPQLSYRRLLEALAQRGWRVLVWSYVPGFDHQAQANEAWRAFRNAGPTSLRLGHSLPFPLLVDSGNALRRAFGVPAVLGLLPGRVTYVIDGQGVIRHVFNNLLDGPAHRREALAALQQLGQG